MENVPSKFQSNLSYCEKNSSKMVSLNQWAKIWEFGVQICSILNEIPQFQVRSAFDVIDVIILYVTTFLFVTTLT